MTSVGDTLRRERLKQNIDLDQVSRELKISRRMLDAIESDQYGRLPGGVFAKAFVRQYAQMLGLDGEDLAAQVHRAIEPPAPAQLRESSRPSVVAIDIPKVEEWRSVGDRGFKLSGSLPAAALVVVVMLVCSAVYAWMQRPRTVATVQPPTPAPAPVRKTEPAPVVAAPQSPPAESTVPPARTAAQPTPTPQSTPVQTATTPAPTPKPPEVLRTSPAPPGPVHVEIVADETVWVLARVDGKFAFSGTLDANTRRAIDGEQDVQLRLGNAGGVTILLNGKPIGPAGPKGQVRTVQLTSGGFQIVPPKPAASAPVEPKDRL